MKEFFQYQLIKRIYLMNSINNFKIIQDNVIKNLQVFYQIKENKNKIKKKEKQILKHTNITNLLKD